VRTIRSLRKTGVILGLICLIPLYADANSFWRPVCDYVLQRKFKPTVAEQIIAAAEQELSQAGIKPQDGIGHAEGFWGVDGPNVTPYDPYFRKVIEIEEYENYLSKFLEARKAKLENTNVLDLFGSGFFLGDHSAAQSITGVRFGPYAGSDVAPTPTEVLGDLLNVKTWNRLDQSMRSRSIPSMDLVVMRPIAGWSHSKFAETAEGNTAALKFIIGNVLKRLNPTGRFYFSICPNGDLPGEAVPGDLTQTPILKTLSERIERETAFRLRLYRHVDWDVDAKTTSGLDGALVPK
jgi:hypothetical protein